MIPLVSMVAILGFSYWVENRSSGRGVPAFFIVTLIWTALYYGPQAFLPGDGCARYSHFAREDC